MHQEIELEGIKDERERERGEALRLTMLRMESFWNPNL